MLGILLKELDGVLDLAVHLLVEEKTELTKYCRKNVQYLRVEVPHDKVVLDYFFTSVGFSMGVVMIVSVVIGSSKDLIFARVVTTIAFKVSFSP